MINRRSKGHVAWCLATCALEPKVPGPSLAASYVLRVKEVASRESWISVKENLDIKKNKNNLTIKVPTGRYCFE